MKREVKHFGLVVCAYVISMISFINEINYMIFHGNLVAESKDHCFFYKSLQTAPFMTPSQFMYIFEHISSGL